MSTVMSGPAVSAGTAPLAGRRPPLNAFGISFGLSGLAGTWTAAVGLGAPVLIANLLWLTAATAWVVTMVCYAAPGLRPRDLAEDLRHPVLGPFAALVPIVGSLLSARLAAWFPAAGEGLVWFMVALSAGFGAWFVARMLTVPRDAATLHGGHLLPTVAASLISAQALATVGHRGAARVLFASGILFWLLIGALLLTRFVTGPEIPRPLLPTLAIFSAPPAVAGNAWWTITQGRPGTAHEMLLGTLAALLLPHLFLAGRYLRLPFALGFWALTFTTAASATYGIRLLSRTGAPWRTPLSWAVVAVATVIIGAVAVRSLALLPFHRVHPRRTGGRTAATSSG
ncbi:C4-dicarboxylate transporter [Streptomyces sp. HPF1205]|uniref:SLAC1 family transporter n=1 Tax=Streptomyces sp. HPF1205 TaxID=2873262 RepID=UPI001CED3B88|nr:C4-dicarboxylate transporter [Streptomyces sp. HPF1205]